MKTQHLGLSGLMLTFFTSGVLDLNCIWPLFNLQWAQVHVQKPPHMWELFLSNWYCVVRNGTRLAVRVPEARTQVQSRDPHKSTKICLCLSHTYSRDSDCYYFTRAFQKKKKSTSPTAVVKKKKLVLPNSMNNLTILLLNSVLFP